MILLLLACSGSTPPSPPPEPPKPAAPEARCTLLTINDTYRIEPLADGTGGMARVRALRTRLEAEYGAVVLLHAGDFLSPSLMSRRYKGVQMIEVLDALDGDVQALDERFFVVFGNHEFDGGDKDALASAIHASQFRWLGSNVRFAADAGLDDPKVVNDARVDCGGIALGLFGITTTAQGAPYITAFDPAAATAEAATTRLRAAGAETVVALTHQSKAEDVAMLEALGAKGPDFVVGGHEHDHQHAETGGRAVYKADADAHTAWRITLSKVNGKIEREEELITLDSTVPEDPAVAAIVATRIETHDKDFCDAAKLPSGCLAESVGTSSVELVGAELDIRRFETNLGDWLVDLAKGAFPDAQIAFANSGSFRLNRNLAAGPIRRQDIEELFAYPSPLVRIEIDGATLQQVVDRSVQEWEGNGHWLQVSGFAWKHDPQLGTATGLTLTATGQAIQPTDKLVAVVPAYLVDPSKKRDGYTMLPAVQNPTGPDLKQLVYDTLAKGGAISPAVEGRICNPMRAGPCLAK